jgi:quercetin dioxygenase-like cupin family protein
MNSGSEDTLDAGVESFGCRVLGEPEDSAGGRIEPRRAGLLYIDLHGADVHPHSATGKETNMTTAKGFVVPAGGGKHLDMTTPGRFAALKLLGHETNESIMLFEETVPVGTKSLFHLHRDSDEVAWVLAGEITFKIGDEVTVGGPGTCAFFPRNVPHAWKNTGSETGRVLFLYTPAAAGGYVEDLLKRPVAPISDDERNTLRERYRWEVVGPNPL